MKSSKNKETNKNNRLIILMLLLIAALLVVILILLKPQQDKTTFTPSHRDPNASVGQIEGKTPEEIQEELNRIVEEGMFNISINPMVTFENGSAEGDLRIENSPANHYLMKVTIILDNSDKVVYTSGLIEPNYHIQTAKLDVDLEQGVYEATALFTAFDTENEAEVGQAAAKITLQVLN